MTNLHDTLTTRLAGLKTERYELDAQIEDRERHVCMGRDWIVEHAEAMAEKFSHLFPAAIPEPVVDTGPFAGVTVEEMAAARDAEKDAHKRSVTWYSGEVARLKEHIASLNPLNIKDMIGKVDSLLVGDPHEALTFHALPEVAPGPKPVPRSPGDQEFG